MLLHTLSFDKVLSDCSEDGNQVKQTLYGSLSEVYWEKSSYFKVQSDPSPNDHS